jgi:S1-C subfamily serine protease
MKKLISIVVIIFVLTVVGLMLLLQSRKTEIVQIPDEETEYITLLEELSPDIKPVGYFSDPESYDYAFGETDREEWLSKIVYQVEYSNNTFAQEDTRSQFPNQKEIFSTVVKVACANEEDEFTLGSGTNFLASGYILTNLHVVKDDDEVLSCMVGFPDPNTGLITEAYWATPIVDDDSDLDLALLSIDDPVFDDELNIYGYYDRIIKETFPVHDESKECSEFELALGEKLYILGYPYLSGKALTITDGLVSSLHSDRDLIITSAKISEGNSGGMAVTSNGCFVGVPTLVYGDGSEEQYGELINSKMVDTFSENISDELEEYLQKGI